MLKPWIKALRPQTLPVSIAGVIAGTGCAVWCNKFNLIPALLCLVFAMLAQIASNFGNEYYDYVKGVDKKGREGFRRGVTEGDITPKAMRNATFATLAAAAITGCAMLPYGGLELVLVGIAVFIFALAYSAGPYPLSHYGLGDLAVILFFGVVPVTFTCYLQCNSWDGLHTSLPLSVAVGLLAANVLIVNNYRDADDDKKVNKRTTVVIFGRKVMSYVYLFSGFAAIALMLPLWIQMHRASLLLPLLYLTLHICTWNKLTKSKGAALNPLLGRTALNLLIFTVLQFIFFCL
jgi:1,4-dihydroxy-2-naphthoate octaprenyltransferase